MQIENQRLDWASLLLRISFGGLMILNHGWKKLGKIMEGGEIKFADPLGMGAELSLYLTVFSEVLCGVLLVLGLFTRLSTLFLSFTMLVAALVVHAGDSLKDREMALLYLAAYLAIWLIGPGRFSLDYFRKRQL